MTSDTIHFPIEDASTALASTISVTPDEHGCTINVFGFMGSLVLDMQDNVLRVYFANEHGDVTGKAIGVLLPDQRREPRTP